MKYFDFKETFYLDENPVTVAIFDNNYKYCLDKQFENACCKFFCLNLNKTNVIPAVQKTECARCFNRDNFKCSG